MNKIYKLNVNECIYKISSDKTKDDTLNTLVIK